MSNIVKYTQDQLDRYNRLATTEQVHLARRIAMHLDTQGEASIPVELADDFNALVNSDADADVMEALVLQERNFDREVKRSVSNQIEVHVHQPPIISERGVSELIAAVMGIVFAFCTLMFAGLAITSSSQNQRQVQPIQRGVNYESVCSAGECTHDSSASTERTRTYKGGY